MPLTGAAVATSMMIKDRVLLGEGVAVGAMRFALVGRERPNTGQNVFSYGNCAQMRRVNAATVAANMVYLFAVRNRPNKMLVGKSMCRVDPPTMSKLTIAI